jgi:hypothetical protein
MKKPTQAKNQIVDHQDKNKQGIVKQANIPLKEKSKRIQPPRTGCKKNMEQEKQAMNERQTPYRRNNRSNGKGKASGSKGPIN